MCSTSASARRSACLGSSLSVPLPQRAQGRGRAVTQQALEPAGALAASKQASTQAAAAGTQVPAGGTQAAAHRGSRWPLPKGLRLLTITISRSLQRTGQAHNQQMSGLPAGA